MSNMRFVAHPNRRGARKSLLPDPATVRQSALKSRIASWDGLTGNWYCLSYSTDSSEFLGSSIVFGPAPLEAVVLAHLRGCDVQGHVTVTVLPMTFVESLPPIMLHHLLSADDIAAIAPGGLVQGLLSARLSDFRP